MPNILASELTVLPARMKALEERLEEVLQGRRGLKDHEISRLVSAIRNAVRPLCPKHQSLRQRISEAMVRELEALGLRIDQSGVGKSDEAGDR